MGKIKDILSDQKNAIRNIIIRYTLTIMSVAGICILMINLNITDYEYENGDIVDDILSYLYLFSVGAFFIESVIKSDIAKSRKMAVYIANAVVSFILNLLAVNSTHIFGKNNEEHFFSFLYFIILLEIGISLYSIIRETRLGLHKYMVNLVFGLIRIGAVLFALNIGLIMILGIFDTLIIDIEMWDIIENIELLLIAFLYVPYGLICITDSKKDKSKFTRGFVMYALMPMVMAAVIIIYLYIFKIIFMSAMPSNEVFSICAWLFVIGVCIWTMAYAFVMDKERLSIYDKIIKYMKYIYAPFIALEIYCIGVRIHQYGMTEERYFAIMFIIFQVIYIVWEPIMNLIGKIRKRDKISYAYGYEGLIFVLVGMYFIGMVAPFINAGYVSYQSQKSRFEAAINELRIAGEEFYETEDFEVFIGTYNYLKYDKYGKYYLETAYDEEELDMWVKLSYDLDYDYVYNYNWESVRSSCKAHNDGVDISGYKTFYMIDTEYGYDNEISYDNLKSLEIEYGLDSKITANIYDCVEYVKNNDDGSSYTQYVSSPYEIIIDNNVKLIIYDIYFSYSDELDKVRSLDIEGYILTR